MENIKTKIYSDGAVLADMVESLNSGNVTGFTTNPSLMKKAGITNYVEFAKEVLQEITEYPVSFEVFSDDLETMEKEAEKIASLGQNVYVKIPVTTSNGTSTAPLLKKLSSKGIKLNVTAIFTVDQVQEVVDHLTDGVASIVSVFAGRIADTGVDPMPIMKDALAICQTKEGCELLWASPREVLNIYQANELGVDIITCTPAIIKKLSLNGKDLNEYSLDTVKTFCKDSQELGFSIL